MTVPDTSPSRTPEPRGQIVREGITVGIATGAYGISFGALSVAAGFDVLQTCALSLLVFTGASQFALIGVVASGGAPLSGAATALLLGLRNGLYGLRLGPLLGWHGPRRAAAAHLVIDESTAMTVNRSPGTEARTGFLATGLAVLLFWNLATLGGALAGRSLGDPQTYGLDAAVGAAFLALLWPRLRDRVNQVTAVLAVFVALVLVPVTTVGFPVLAAGLVAVLVGLVTTRPEGTGMPGPDDRASDGRRES